MRAFLFGPGELLADDSLMFLFPRSIRATVFTRNLALAVTTLSTAVLPPVGRRA